MKTLKDRLITKQGKLINAIYAQFDIDYSEGILPIIPRLKKEVDKLTKIYNGTTQGSKEDDANDKG